ncbi:hypothetical protein K9M59_03940 [Candidatus Gracilibacteria bacterium]|nr:hypothetical protein [Candidatus Gracilibacteria bacterium]MCF7819475.1 hypothetical protein [Candidatus Gracilibacteria bacterium]
MKIYQDAHEESDFDDAALPYGVEILNRIGQHERGREFTQEERKTLSELSVPDVHQQSGKSLEQQIGTSRNIQNLYNYESRLLREENNLARRNGLRSMFANDTLSDSPFDLIQDLREIDALFFGEKYQTQKPDNPSFLTYGSGQTDFILEQENWQDQREGSLQEEFGGDFTDKEYDNFSDSLTGIIVGIVTKPIQKMTGYPLVGGISTKGMFEFASHSGMSQDSTGSGAFGKKGSPPDKTEPLADQVESQDIAQELRRETEQLLESHCVETAQTERRDYQGKIETFFACEEFREDDFQRDLKQIQLDAEWNAATDPFLPLSEKMQQWNQDLKSYLKSAEEIHQIFKDDFEPKPQK